MWTISEEVIWYREEEGSLDSSVVSRMRIVQRQSSPLDYVVYRLAELYSYHVYPGECGSDINFHSGIVCFDYNDIRIDQEHVYSMECVFILECSHSIDKVYIKIVE